MVCHDGIPLNLNLTKTPMVGVAKLNLVSMDQKQTVMEVVLLEQLQGTHGEAREKMGLPQTTFVGRW